MPLILVVEQEQRYVERISEALSSHGWDVKGVHDRAAALAFAAEHSASVVVVNSEVPESRDLIKSLSRRAGGPSTVVLLPENSVGGASAFGADEVLQKPFTDQDIRLAVRRCLSGVSSITISDEAADQHTLPSITKSTNDEFAVEEGDRLTSADIFGDVVQELETALSAGTLGEVVPPEPAALPVVEPPPVEPPVVETPVEPEPIVEMAVEPEPEPEVEPEPEPEVEEEPEVEALLEEDAAAVAEKEPAEEPPAAKPPEAPRLDPAALLDARILQAAEEGKRLSATTPRPTASSEPTISTDDLMRRALDGIDVSNAPVGDMKTEATTEEVDRLVSAVTKSKDAAADQPPPAADATELEEAELDKGGEAAVLEVVGDGEGEYQTRLKLIGAIIIIGVLGLLAFFLMRNAGESVPPPSGTPGGAIETPAATQGGRPAGDAESSIPGEGEVESAGGPTDAESEDAEDGLRRELDAQRRQLQEEIAKSQSSSADDDGR